MPTDISMNFCLVCFLFAIDKHVSSAQLFRTRGPIRSRYHNFEELEYELKIIANQYPEKTDLYSIGKSTEGRDLWVLALTNQRPAERLLLRPEVKYVASMHGDEPLGTELLLRFAQELLNLPKKCLDSDRWCQKAKILLDSVRIHILFLMNPDGYIRAIEGLCSSRTNPLDGLNTYSAAPDDRTLRFLALQYAKHHPVMRKGLGCGRKFRNGVANGAAWYYVKGSMMDYDYWEGAMSTTLELSCCKFPLASVLRKEYRNNRNSLLEYLLQVNQGVRGIIVNSTGQIIANAALEIEGRQSVFYTTHKGEFWRILLPGLYTLKVSPPGSSTIWGFDVHVGKYGPGEKVPAYKVIVPKS